ncbi:thioredoxin family protein [Oceanidesulfovibrio marinus]|uniref:Thioredoxin 1 n=2 Tax=Oceanidesulfovibrio marinus TaxID=370038 RepID=A0ABX6NK26_9BACT|nr:thioredoxin family protein [Oceanidesulfovibrio marinus]QJT10571.1 hypothetical protein E8L03_17320 [Oceanidesulfovibrio marinus]
MSMKVESAFEHFTGSGFEVALKREAGFVLLACLRQEHEMRDQEDSLREVARQYDGQLKVWILDDHGQDKFHVQHRVMGTPTYLLFKNGAEKDRVLGKLSCEGLLEFVSRNLD